MEIHRQIGPISILLIIIQSLTKSFSVYIISMKYGSLIIARQQKKLLEVLVADMVRVEIYYIDGEIHKHISRDQWKINSSLVNMMRNGSSRKFQVEEISLCSIMVSKDLMDCTHQLMRSLRQSPMMENISLIMRGSLGQINYHGNISVTLHPCFTRAISLVLSVFLTEIR